MTPLHVVHVSDTHLAAPSGPARGAVHAARREQARRGWTWFVDELRADPPDLVVHTGDVVLDDPDAAADHHYARVLLAGLGIPVLLVPGNHDVGDRPHRGGLPAGWLGPAFTAERAARWRAVWGADHWAHAAGGWVLIGVDSALMGSGVDGEEQQWSWLHDRLRRAGGPIALFLHEAPRPGLLGLTTDSWAAVPEAAQDRLAALVERYDVRLVGSGHLHRFHVGHHGDATYVTAPSLASPIPEHPELTRPAGDPSTGFLRYALTPDDLTLRPVLQPEPATSPHARPTTTPT